MWKQKGEEYRVTGYGGWSWISKTYVPQFAPRLPGNTNANYRKELEGLGIRKDLVFSLSYLVFLDFGPADLFIGCCSMSLCALNVLLISICSMNRWNLISLRVVLLSLIDAKLGKKCTLLDLSRRPSVPESESQGVAVLSCITKGQNPASSPKSPLDCLTSADLESCETVEEEMKEWEAEKEKSEELPAEDSPTKMELDPTDPVSDENKRMSLKLIMYVSKKGLDPTMVFLNAFILIETVGQLFTFLLMQFKIHFLSRVHFIR